MFWENGKEYNFMEMKDVERNCLNLLLRDTPKFTFGIEIQNLLKGNIRETERPDFLINNIGIEHFLIDLLFKTKSKKAMSIERKNRSSIIDKVDYYKENPHLLDKDIDNGSAVEFVENMINSQINAISDFSYNSFVDNYKRVFDNHYNNISKYRSYCTKLGFLIEIPYSETNYYIITNKDNCRAQAIRTMPIPRDILTHIWKYRNIDFVVLCIRPMYLSNKTRKKDISIIYIDPKNQKYFGDRIVLCDSFDFPHKFPEKDIVKLDVVP